MKRVILLLGLLVVLILTGCMQPNNPGSTSTPTSTLNVDISPAPITELQILTAKSLPPQFSATFKVGLRDTCTTFNDLTTTRSGNTITITVTVQHEKDKICGQLYGFMDKTVSLGSNFTSGQTYTVNVNDQTTTFTVP
jgi:hypothetical protein